MIWLCAATEGEREIAGANENDVDAGRGSDFIDVRKSRQVFHNDDDDDALIGKIVVAFGCGHTESSEVSARSARARRRVAAGRDRLLGERGRARKWEDYPEHA